MSKFMIECSQCGRFMEAKTGLLARRKLECACGNVVNVRLEKMVTRTCPECGNLVVFDVSRKDKVKCPVCRKPVRAIDDHSKLVEFSCEQCGAHLHTVKTADTFTCPLCDHVNDVVSQLRKEQMRNSGFASIIKYEGDNETIIWKHPIEDFNMGSQLIVHESQEALFFKDGQALDLFGAGRHTLETQQLPLLEKLYKLPTNTEETFHSEVYFINLITQMGIRWGTDTKVRLFDPASGMHVELGASGECNIRVINSRKLLLKLVGTGSGLTQEQLMAGNKALFRPLIMTQVKSFLAQTIKDAGISVLEIDAHLMELSEALKIRINASLEEYGFVLSDFFVSRIMTPDDDPNFIRMKEQYAQEYLNVREEQIRLKTAQAAAQRKAVEVETEARMKIISAQGEAEAMKLKAMAEADAYRAQAMAEAEEMRAKGYTYQQETARMVGMEAMQHGLTGNGNGAGAGSSMIGDLASLGVTLGTVGSVIGMTKDAMAPVLESTTLIGQNIGNTLTDTWNCSCGNQGIRGKFCNECGAQKPEPHAETLWDCNCGSKGNKGKFCSECGAARPVQNMLWDCSCGNKGITGNFCSECGSRRTF